jgi:hypothetical protein
MSNSPLYKQIDANTFVRFDPATDRYDIVRADRAPRLEPVTQRVRLSANERRADAGAMLRRLLVLAMLDVAEKDVTTGDPTASIAHLLFLARLPERPDELRRIPQLAWAIPSHDTANAPERPANVKAVLNGAAAPSTADLFELITALPSQSVAALRKARALCEHAWNAQKLRPAVAELVRHAQHAVDAPPAARLSLAGGKVAPVRRNPVRPGMYRRL